MSGPNGAQIAMSAAVTPLLAASAVLMVVGGGGATASPDAAVCGGGGHCQTIQGVHLGAEQMGNARTIVAEVAGRHLPVYAADVAVTTAYTESTLHNDTTQADHDSEGLFQQRVRYYIAAVAGDPVKATNAFLDRLVTVSNWQNTAVGVDAQAVQHSKYPGKYQPNAPLAAAIVGQFWPTASGAAGPAQTTPPRRSPRHRPGRARTPAGGPAARRAESRARRRPPRHWAASRRCAAAEVAR